MVWRIDDPQGDEAGKVKYEIVQYTRGKGIDLGCGPKKAYPHFIGVDSCKDTELFGIEMKPDVVCKDASDLDFIEEQSLDFIFSSHLLEHIEDHRAALTNWWSKIKPGGHLVLYLPHADLYPRVGTDGCNPDHKHDFTGEDILDAMGGIGYNVRPQSSALNRGPANASWGSISAPIPLSRITEQTSRCMYASKL
jgi:predicted SAM-dependent methyltransferase